MKKRTKAQKFNDFADAINCIRQGKLPKRSRAKDESILTHPVVSVNKTLSEKEVLELCLKWLKKKRIMCWRHDSGAFENIRGQWATYGIINAGDVIGMTKTGRYFEIECKRGQGGRLTKGQQKHWRKVKSSNGIYLIISGIEELEYYNARYHYFD